ncbi:MAG TPA: tripartite tricarboxylate transporter substrate binding protein [Xanthobacteraceae bacterium]|nr:tripartite tricarboxylate transporter substrate binding protein [Xanthobacteraceae bacterium]
MRAKALPLFAALMLIAATGAARALDFPTRTIRVVVPFAAAGVTDIVARIVFDKVAQALGQKVIIDNRPGAGGTIAVDAVAHSPPDGYTLVMADPSGSLPANLTLYPKLNFHPLHDLAPIASLGTTGAVLLVANELPAKSIQEFVALAKAKPGELTFVSTGNGTPGHLNGELFMRLAGIKAVHIPYRVVSQGVTDLVTSRVSFWIAPIPTLLSQIQAGQVRPLAVAGDARSADLPGIPTVKESGIGDFDASTTYGLFAPAGTPPEIIERIFVEVKRALEIDSVRQKLRAAGVDPGIGTPDDVKRLLETKIPQWAEVIKSAGIKIDDH